MSPAAQEGTRPDAGEIYERVTEDARTELERAPTQLAFSGLFAGAAIGFTPLAYVLVLSVLPPGEDARLIAAIFYPIGFIAVILGRGQLFTENTLYPVALVLQERRHLVRTARLWAIVFAMNTIGGLLFALLVILGDPVSPEAQRELVRVGEETSAGSFFHNFWPAVISGWLLALVAWLVEASETAIGQAVVIWALTFLVGLGQFDHSVASTVEVLAGIIDGAIDVDRAIGWTATAVLGNVLGGVFIVAVLNYGQAQAGEHA